ncbi:MAG: hypothetical protein LBH17_07665 [Oscillospiraceae bacterium]|jgi:hypothetical protein|nr:hypothetical protein [Oscillospiraceae bacterium]
MPAMMMHLAVARLVRPDGDGLFFSGSMSPDYTDAREIKSYIHLRDRPDRGAALAELRDSLDLSKPFDEGWLLHLFADAIWDVETVPRYEASHTDTSRHWFWAYRSEQGSASHWMYHNMPWSRGVWDRIDSVSLADTRTLDTPLPVPLELDWYIDRVRRKHSGSAGERSEFFSPEMVEAFAEATAAKYLEWVKG